MSEHESDLTALEGSAVTTLLERQLAVEHWLLGATEDRATARGQWAALDVALLSLGGILSAVRAPARMVWSAAGTDELRAVDAHLRKWFDGGAVFMDLHATQYYFLVPGSTPWPWTDRQFPGVERLGRDHFLGVPAPRLTKPRGRSYWCVPMDSPGDLCYPDEVVELLKVGRAARALEGGIR